MEGEADTRADRIDPVLKKAGWGVVRSSLIRREVVSPGRIHAGGGRERTRKSDYVLHYRGQKLAVLEAKRVGESHRSGVDQAKDYAQRLRTPFAYASNGLRWYEIDMVSGAERDFELPFPTPDELWERTFADRNDWRERFGAVDFEGQGGKWEPRHYQHNAIAAVLEAVGRGNRRVLLTMATGTGKTFVAFQVAWKLFQSRWSLSGEPTHRPRILFLADRNILADQAFNAFSAFPKDAVTRVHPDSIRRRGSAPKNASVFFTIFQTFMIGDEVRTYTDYPPGFFDFIVVDECHRGGARDESTWRAILEYFEPAVQLGLTATPKREQNAGTYAYFGEPVYTYALRDGIEDGYLTPFKVRQIASTIDEYVYDPSDTVLAGEVREGDEFKEENFNRDIVMQQRELSRVREFMRQIDQTQKTIVFCATQNHAALVRDLINQVKDSADPHYCCRVTADEGEVGDQHLRHFQDNDRTIPTILTTSYKLSTGVDARNVRHIVLMRKIRSIIEFKQIIGRGTRTYEGKDFFTIWDFVRAYENFNDPEWDGEPEEPVVLSQDVEDRPVAYRDADDTGTGDRDGPVLIEIRLADGKARTIRYIASTSYWGEDGRPISAQELVDRLFGELSDVVTDEDQLRRLWSDPDRRERLFGRLYDSGYDLGRLEDIRGLIDAKDSDLFDVLRYVGFALDPKTREERAAQVRKHGLSDVDAEMKSLLLEILEDYEERGERELARDKLSMHLTARYGSVGERPASLGELADVTAAYDRMQAELYAH